MMRIHRETTRLLLLTLAPLAAAVSCAQPAPPPYGDPRPGYDYAPPQARWQPENQAARRAEAWEHQRQFEAERAARWREERERRRAWAAEQRAWERSRLPGGAAEADGGYAEEPSQGQASYAAPPPAYYGGRPPLSSYAPSAPPTAAYGAPPYDPRGAAAPPYGAAPDPYAAAAPPYGATPDPYGAPPAPGTLPPPRPWY